MSQPIKYGLADEHLGRIYPQKNGHLVMYSDYAALAAENERLHTAMKDIEKAWYSQRSGDVIKIVDKALEWKDANNE